MTYREALESLVVRDGFLTPEQVLAEASNPESPLHSHFEWDDNEAARRYRMDQAGRLIRSVNITVQVGNEEVRKVRAYTFVPTAQPQYVPTDQALSGEHRDVVLAQALKELAALRRKYQSLIDFASVLEQFAGETQAEAA